MLVYPHMLTVGGSQLNAVELAGAVRDLGHEVIVFGTPGPLVEVVHDLGLRYVASPHRAVGPQHVVVRALGTLVGSARSTCCTLRVASGDRVLPSGLPAGAQAGCLHRDVHGRRPVPPLADAAAVLGTRHIQATVQPRRRGRRDPAGAPGRHPSNGPEVDGSGSAAARCSGPRSPGVLTVVVVSRLARGAQAAGAARGGVGMPELAAELPRPTSSSGDGPARPDVAAAASRGPTPVPAGRSWSWTGEVLDPRPSLRLADVSPRHGRARRCEPRPTPVRSSSRASYGFWEELNADSVERFLYQGWYGTGDGGDGSPTSAPAPQAAPDLDPAAWGAELGAFGRRLVEERFTLRHAALASRPRSRASWPSDIGSRLPVADTPCAARPVSPATSPDAGCTGSPVGYAEEDFNAVGSQPRRSGPRCRKNLKMTRGP